MRAEDYDDFDEAQAEYQEARPVDGRAVTAILSVPLAHDDFQALGVIARREGRSVIDVAQDAVRASAATRSERNSDRLADIIGSVRGGGAGRARDTGAAFGDMLVERRNKP